MQSRDLIQVELLHKAYGSIVAVNDVSFEVHKGEIFGMVGPNGAGKTTIIECIEGLRRPDSGHIQVLGLHPQRDKFGLRQRIGIQLQDSALPNHIKVWEAVDLFASFYSNSIDWQPLLQRLGLAEKHNIPVAKLSGGQKQRLFIALALINDPELVFLDELTTGLDPQARRTMWDLVREYRAQGKTIVLTTHFMEEAERLCDRVAILDHGQIIALDSPENLIRNLGVEQRVVFTIEGRFEPQWLSCLETVINVESVGSRVIVSGNGYELVNEVVTALTSHGVRFRDLRTEQPNLEDVFLALTGREIRT